MGEDRPQVSIGHVVMHVADAMKSADFYESLGARIVENKPRFSLVELRGGTHILFSEDWQAVPASRLGAPAPDRREDFELMIGGDSRQDLELYRESLTKGGLTPSPIEDEKYHGHYIFQIDDPDGNCVTIYSSHVVGPV